MVFPMWLKVVLAAMCLLFGVDMLKDNFLKKFDKVLPRAISISLFLLVYFALSYPVSNPGIKIILLGPSLAGYSLVIITAAYLSSAPEPEHEKKIKEAKNFVSVLYFLGLLSAAIGLFFI